MEDKDIVAHIGELMDEEHRLESTHSGTPLSEEDLGRLRSIEISLDQCWDLLRQRRGRREAGQDANKATTRPQSMVEGYEQ